MKILIVDDSILIRNMIRKFIDSFPDFTVAGEASNGKKALELIPDIQPDIVLMDVNMPVMDGITATNLIMNSFPVPIIIFTSEDVAEVGYKALNVGALEVVPKPDINKMNDKNFLDAFETILKHVAQYGQMKIKSHRRAGLDFSSEIFKRNDIKLNKEPAVSDKRFQIVVMGASTGGPTAVRTVLSSLPENFPLPIILTQHIEIGFDKGYAEWLNDATPLYVRLAKQYDILKAGEVLVASASAHLVCRENEVFWDDGPRVDNQKPSVDKMFLSAVEEYKEKTVGILLTGMGRDGARGCNKIKESGGFTFVQDKDSSMIFGMPKAAIELGGASQVLPLDKIAESLIKKVMF